MQNVSTLFKYLVAGVWILSFGGLHAGENMDPVHQFEQMLHRPYADKAAEMELLFKYMEDLYVTIKADELLRQFHEIARMAKDEEMKWEANLLEAYYHLMHTNPPQQNDISRMQKLADKAGREGRLHIQARAVRFVSHIYWFRIIDYEKAFESYFELQKIVSKMSPENFPDLAFSYLVIGRAHYFFRNYRKAINIFRKAAILPQTAFNKYHVTRAQNNIGLCYQQLDKLDSSDYYFNKIIRDTSIYAIDVWKAIASGSLGYNFYLRKQYDKAEPLLQQDIESALRRENRAYAVVSLTPLADIRIEQNRLQEAGKYIFQARELIENSGDHDRLRLLYPVISKWHAAMGNAALASDYLDSTILAIEEYNEKFSSLILLRARQKINAQERQIQELENQEEIQRRNIFIAVVSLLFLSGIVFYWFRNKYLLRKQEIKELALKNTRESLDHARDQLKSLTRRIRENNKLINQMKNTIGQNRDHAVLEDLRNTTILTQEDWDQFKNHFQRVYPGYMNKLRSNYPDLTHGELRHLCLTKLDLTNHEMASAQGVSNNSVRVTKYRIRKKLGLTNEDELKNVIAEN